MEAGTANIENEKYATQYISITFPKILTIVMRFDCIYKFLTDSGETRWANTTYSLKSKQKSRKCTPKIVCYPGKKNIFRPFTYRLITVAIF